MIGEGKAFVMIFPTDRFDRAIRKIDPDLWRARVPGKLGKMRTSWLLLLSLALGLSTALTGCGSVGTRAPAASVIVQVIEEDDYCALLPREREPGMPVLYFLHGRGNSQHMFRDMGGVDRYLEYLKQGGRPFAVVAFRGGDENRAYYWVDEAGEGGLAWASYLMKDLLPKVEARHGIGGARDRRVIAGISMGAAGAFQLSMNFPNLFRCTAGHSFVARDAASAVEEFPISFGSEKIYRERFDPIELAKRFRARGARPFEKAWIDIGGNDRADWLARAAEMAAELKLAGYPATTFDIGKKFPDAAHSYEYWRERMPEYLSWYASCLFGD